MALVTGDINWQGFGKVTDADSTTGWAVIKTTSGGGTPSPALADGGLQGVTSAQAITTTSNSKRILLYYDIGSGNELDFTPSTGTEAGEFVWVWGNFLASGLLELVSANGFGIMLGTDNAGTVDWSVWTFYGSDNYSGGWKRMVIDPTKTASLTGSGATEGGGGITLSSVRYFGIMAKTNATARFDNMVVDRIDVGTGYAIDGTGSTADAFMSDLLAVEESVANWWGVIQRLNDSGTAYQLQGNLTIGDSVGTTATTISDIDAKIFAAEPRYYNSGLVAAIPLTAIGINMVGNATGATSITIGKAVGSDAGRNGWTIVGNSTYNVGIDWDDGNVNTNNWYGCSFESLSGTLSWGTNTSHKLFSSSFSGCEQFDPVGGIVIRNCNFSSVYDDGTADASKNSALLWNGSINIQSCNFLANSHASSDIAHGIEYPAAGTFGHTAMNFSGNEVDIHFSATTGNLVINRDTASNASSSTNDSTGTVTIQGSVNFTLTNVVSGTAFTLDGEFTTSTPAGTYNGTGDSIIQFTGSIPSSFATSGTVRLFNGTYYDKYSYTGVSGSQLTGVTPTLTQDYDGVTGLLVMIAPTTITVDPYTVSVEPSQAFQAMLANYNTTRYQPIQFSDNTGTGFARRISQTEE